MTRLLLSLWMYRLLRWMIAGLFLAAGVAKAMDPDRFVETVADFGILPEPVVPVTAVGLITAEIVAGLGLAVDVRGALALTVSMLVLFVGVLSYGIALGLDIDCGCFGPGEESVSLQQAMMRDLALLAGCGLAYISRWSRAAGPMTWQQILQRVGKIIGAKEQWIP